MNKKLLAVAVAGALAAPGVALAQASSVTISGFFKVGWEHLDYANSGGTAGINRLNSSQNRVVDNSSRVIFNSVEDLGNGLAAVGQLDVRFAPDQASNIQTSNPIGSGNTFVGLKSNTMGMLTIGRWDLHYGKAGDATADKAGALQATAISLFDYIGAAPIANTTRTQNVIKWDSPNWNGFTGTVAWSANPIGNSEQDMLNVTSLAGLGTVAPGQLAGTAAFPATFTPATQVVSSRKGSGWNVSPNYSNGPFNIGYSYWKAEGDAPINNLAGTTGTNDQKGHSLYGAWKFGGFKIGLAWNRSELDNALSGTKVAERDAWSIPMSYTWGPNNIVGHYTQARKISSNVAGAVTDNTGARMYAVAYVYDMSKRTSLAATYARIDNDTNASYNFFTSASLGSTDAVPVAGEKPRLLQLSIKHAF